MYSKNVVIVAWKRTPIGMFKGIMSEFTAPNLGSISIQGALASSKIDPREIEEVIMGEVLQASVGQAPARQAAIEARLPISTPCTTVNKGWASGMRSVILGTQMIASGSRKTVVAGGMESMTGSPHYVNIRQPIQYSHTEFVDSILLDGYTYTLFVFVKVLCLTKFLSISSGGFYKGYNCFNAL